MKTRTKILIAITLLLFGIILLIIRFNPLQIKLNLDILPSVSASDLINKDISPSRMEQIGLSNIYNNVEKSAKILNSYGNDLGDFKLIYNTYSCGGDLGDCYAIIKLNLPYPQNNILSNLRFNDLKRKEDTSLDYEIKIRTNDTNYQDYDPETIYDSGIYYIKIKGIKNENDIIDWIPEVFGSVEIDNWAIWGNVYSYDLYPGTTINSTKWTNSTINPNIASIFQDDSSDVGITCSSQNICSPGCQWYTCNVYLKTNTQPFTDFNSINNLTVRVSLTGSGAGLHGCSFSAFGNVILTNNADQNITFRKNYTNNKFTYYNETGKQGEITPSSNDLMISIGSYADTATCTGKMYIINYSYSNNSIGIGLNPPNNYNNYGNNVSFIASVNTSINNLANISFYLNGVLNETRIITGTSNVITFNRTLNFGIYNWKVYVCDDDNNCRFSSINSLNNVPFVENSIIYNSTVPEGSANTIISNMTIYNPTSIILNYGGTYYYPTILNNGNNYILTTNVNAPLVNYDSNITFYYTISSGTGIFNSTIYNQTVQNVQLSINCSVGTSSLITLNNYDEESLQIMNGTIEYLLTLTGNNGDIAYINGNATGSNVSICSSVNLSSSYTYYNLQLRYYDLNGSYLTKTYNIQNSPTNNLPLNINLYYLLKSYGTQFKIYYTDFNYLTYPNAIMQIQRQYLSENLYRTVEIPKLDNNGNTLASFNTNNIRYKIIVINNGNVLDTFNDVFPICQNIVLGECSLNLRGTQHNNPTNNGDFTYSLVRLNNSLILTYIIPSGTPRNIEFITNQDSRYLNNISTCDTNIFASGGTITCNYNNTVGDSIVSFKILNSDGSQLYGSIQVSEDLSGFFLLNNYFIGFILVLLLALIFISSGALLIIVAIFGLLFMGLIFLLKGMDWFTLTGSLGWIVVAGILIVYKISKREEVT